MKKNMYMPELKHKLSCKKTRNVIKEFDWSETNRVNKI